MGGVITRIALREMENENKPHQTRLFISQDSPQQGANVPIAYQYTARHFRNIYISTGVAALGAELIQLIRGKASPLKALSLANEPASKQMLINYISDFGTLRNVHHDDFYASLRTLGYPQGTIGHPFRMVAISNGSECANAQGFEPGASLIAIDGKIQTTFLGDLAFMNLSTLGSFIFPISRLFKFGALPGRNEFITSLHLNAIANGGGNEVYYCNIAYRKKLFYLVNINISLAHKQKDADSGMMPIDGYPGGFFAVPLNLQSSSASNFLIKYNITASIQNSFNFIPTTSSLDIGGGATTLNSADFLRVYSASSPPVAPKQTPFANFIVARQNNASVNESHLSFTARNADWAGNEITSNLLSTSPPIVDCSYLCNGVLQIQGPSQFCATETFSIPNLPAGATVNWSLNPSSGVANMSVSGNTASLTKIANGNVQLSATVISDCGNIILTPKNIKTGVYPIEFSGIVSGANYRGGSYFTVYATGEYVNANNFNWTVYGADIISGQGTNAISITTHLPLTDNFLFLDIFVSTNTSNCGTANGYIQAIVVNDGPPTESRIAIYPNPVSSELTVEYTDKNRISNISSIKLINNKGETLKLLENINKTKLLLNLDEIPNGTYYLHITEGKETIKKQIIIKH
jgi:hypothetical protein